MRSFTLNKIQGCLDPLNLYHQPHRVSNFYFQILACLGFDIAQVVSRQLHIGEDRLRANFSHVEFVVHTGAWEQAFLSILLFSSVNIISTLLCIQSCIIWVTKNGPIIYSLNQLQQ
jgi:hypothetical protein